MKKFFIFFCIFFNIFFFLKLYNFLYINSNFYFEIQENNFNKKINTTEIIEKVLPTIVNIFSEDNFSNNFYIKNYFSFFFKKNSPFCNFKSPFYNSSMCYKNEYFKNFKEKNFFSNISLGSGIIIDKINGYIVTNNHVVNNFKNINVKLYDGRIYKAKILIQNIDLDLAIIKIFNVHNLNSILIKNIDKVKIGEKVLAIGNSYGLENTVTYGIVSSINRHHLGIEYYENFIQIDASINKGNSGGPLLNLKGELIGINTAVFSPYGGNVGIGFSIPIKLVKIILNKFINYEKNNGYFFYLNIINIDLNFSKIYNINVNRGIFLSNILNISFFSKFNFKDRDIIISLNNKRIIDFLSFKTFLICSLNNSLINIKIIRDHHLKIVIFFLNDFFLNNFLIDIKKKFLKNIIFIDYNINNIKYLKIKRIKNIFFFNLNNFKKYNIIISINNVVSSLKNFNFLINNFNSLVLYLKKNNNFIYFIIK
ncbi:trypsin-like peptidase domain-containing protein [Buchnera aphidicola]|uniref:trypsin-like peptidase domain-containing protein n=1 Tax=Buchnera aphidicola TaxID=9 RepID=UPI0031B825F7